MKINSEESDMFYSSVSIENSDYKGQDRGTFLRIKKSFDNKRDKNFTKITYHMNRKGETSR